MVCQNWPVRLSTAQAVVRLNEGLVVAVPTQTVYGFAARADDQAAVSRVFVLKGRRPALPCPVLVESRVHALGLLASAPSAGALRLMDAFWPGPMTLVLPGARRGLAAGVLGAGQTVGVRVDGTGELQILLSALGLPVTGTSANRSGEQPLTRGAEVDAHFEGVPGYAGYLGDEAGGGVPSTVVSVLGGLEILREGAVAAEDLRRVWGGGGHER
jgi:L-threonylcarbamoyladenylate synthase